jgi:hypothetical protein
MVIIDPARLHCDIAAEKQPQVLRLRNSQSTRTAPLRMTDFLYCVCFKPEQDYWKGAGEDARVTAGLETGATIRP